MKKIAILSLCCGAVLGMSAQTTLVKDVERQLKSNIENYPAQANAIKPAFENPETKDLAQPYFMIGEAAFKFSDHLQGQRAIGKQVDDKAAGHAMIDGYYNLLTAMQKDSLPDEKGKVKPKYSSKVIKLIKDHYAAQDFANAGVYLWGVQDYQGAYDAWNIYLNAPYNPILGANAPAAPADSTVADMNFNMGLAAWQAERLDDALAAFDTAIAKGYDKKAVYDYAISVASQKGDNARMAQYASQAFPIFGKEDDRYIGFMINDKLQNKQYDEAMTMLEQYIQADPNNAQLYYVRGVIYDTKEEPEKAMADYKKSLDLAPDNSSALFNYGRTIYNKAIILSDSDALANLPTAEYNKALEEQVYPIFREAAGYLEKAYQLDEDNMASKTLPLLRNIYYNLKDDSNLKRIEELEKY